MRELKEIMESELVKYIGLNAMLLKPDSLTSSQYSLSAFGELSYCHPNFQIIDSKNMGRWNVSNGDEVRITSRNNQIIRKQFKSQTL